MIRLFLKFCSILISILIVSLLLDGVYIRSAPALLIMGLTLIVVNLVLKPILLIVALPINILSFGLVSLIVNLLTIKIADGFVMGVHIGGFLNSLAVAFLISLFNSLLLGTDLNKHV